MAWANPPEFSISEWMASPSNDVLGLAYTEISIAGIVLVLAGIIAWKHGKAGLVCWPIFVWSPIAVMVLDIYMVVNKEKPLLPNAVSTMTVAAVLACMTLTIIGIVYECNAILPSPPKAKATKVLLVMTHLVNTLGIGMSTYAGARSATGVGGVRNQTMNQISNLMMLLTLLIVCGWMWPTFHKICHYEKMCHPNAEPARNLFWGGVAAMPFWLMRIGYNMLFAFVDNPSLDPVRGSFSIKLVLLFTMWLGASSALCVSGWLGVPRAKAESAVQYCASDSDESRTHTDVEMLCARGVLIV